MNKKILILITAFLVLAFGHSVFASGLVYNGFNVVGLVVDGRTLVSADVPPINMNGRVLIPVRMAAEALGAQVEWDGTANSVIITSAPGAADEPEEPASTIELKESLIEVNRVSFNTSGDFLTGRVTNNNNAPVAVKLMIKLYKQDEYLGHLHVDADHIRSRSYKDFSVEAEKDMISYTRFTFEIEELTVDW